MNSRVAKATIEDPEVLSALEEAEEEHGSLADAVRHAVATTYATTDDGSWSAEHDLPVKAVEGYRKLTEWKEVGGRIELKTAESILANHLNVRKEAIRSTVIRPLREANAIALHQGIHNVSIVVGTLDASGTPEATSSTTEPVATDGGNADADADDIETAGERLDELAGAEVER
ncbi:hypothetical protein GWK26_08765 [haloarchaeon 3A1-DGR]|nr:hypothetical protein GWK26_08765 [haloarchaeon 3A1-DGR]